MSENNQPNLEQQIENLLVEVTVMVRDAYLRAKKGRPALNYWSELIPDRMRSAARQSATAGEWITTVQRKLQTGAPNSSDSLVINRLVQLCDENDYHLRMMEFIDREISFLIAMARSIVDGRKAQRSGAVPFTADEMVEAAKDNGLFEEKE